jgi:hypothetical protein
MRGWIAVLHATIVAGREETSIGAKNCGADGKAAFGETFASFGERDSEHRGVICCGIHGTIHRAIRPSRTEARSTGHREYASSLRK